MGKKLNFAANTALLKQILKREFPNIHFEGQIAFLGSINGEKGRSLNIALSGSKAGLAYDHATGEGWNLPQLIMVRRGITYPAAMKVIEGYAQGLGTKYLPIKTGTNVDEPEFDPDRAWSLNQTYSKHCVEIPYYDGQNPIVKHCSIRGIVEPFQHAMRSGAPLKMFINQVGYVTLISKHEGFRQCFGLHQTHINWKGYKAQVKPQKCFMTKACSLKGGAVRLFPATHQVGVAEGIETALACYELFKIPMWATCGASLLAEVDIPPEVSKVFICVDHDPNGCGRNAGEKLAKRLVSEGRQVKILDPADFDPNVRHSSEKVDWLDVLNRKQAAAGRAKF